MAALAVVVFTEQLWRYSRPLAQAVEVALEANWRPGHLVPVAAPRPARLRHVGDVRQAMHNVPFCRWWTVSPPTKIAVQQYR